MRRVAPHRRTTRRIEPHLGPQLPVAQPPVAWPLVKHCADGVQVWHEPRSEPNRRPHAPRRLPHEEQLPHEVPLSQEEEVVPQEVLHPLVRQVWQAGRDRQTGCGQHVGGASRGQ